MILPRSLSAALAAVLLLAADHPAFAQGPIVPTGTPGPTMKTLDQVEARIPIPGGTTRFATSVSGSYYLTGNLAVTGNAISISADNVTIDLNGYSITSTADTSSYGVAVTSANNGNVTIRNGSIHGQTTYSSGAFTPGGFVAGIAVRTSGAVRIENVTVTGVNGVGIQILRADNNPATMAISHCTVNIASGKGIETDGFTSIDHCVASPCGDTAISGTTVSDCFGYCTGSGNGITGSTVLNSFGESSNGYGVLCYQNGTNCIGFGDVNATGFSTNGTAVGCRGESNGTGTGLRAAVASHCHARAYGSGNAIVTDNATDCEGTASGAGTGVRCSNIATNCYGSSGTGVGLSAITANTCVGTTGGTLNTSYGIDCGTLGIATGCRGSVTSSSAVAVALRTFIGNSCVVSGGTISIPNKYNMP